MTTTSGQSGADLTPDDVGNLLRNQISTFDSDFFNSLSVEALQALRMGQFAVISGSAIAGMTPTTFGNLLRKHIASLTTEQIQAMNVDEVMTLGVGKLSMLSSTQLSTFDPSLLNALGVYRISNLSATQVGSLTTDQIEGLSRRQVQAMSNFTVAQFQGLSDLGFYRMTGQQLDALGGAGLSQLNPARFTATQMAGLTASTVGGLSSTFVAGLSPWTLSAISTAAVAALPLADLRGLSADQLASFTSAQTAAMTSQQHNVLASANGFMSEAIKLEVAGMLPYSGALQVLQDAAVGGMTADKLTKMAAVDAKVMTQDQASISGVDDAILVSPAVNSLFSSVLGSLTATTTEAQFDALISKYFLGGDLPGLQTDAAGDMAPATYQHTSLPLFGPSGGPVVTDVNQGAVKDGWLLATLAETAVQDPSYIKNMIQDNGNGAYTVQFQSFGNPFFITVDNELPTLANGSLAFANSSSASWAGVIERAAAQLTQLGSSTGLAAASSGHTDQYAALASGADDWVTALTGEAMTSNAFTNFYPQNVNAAEFQQVAKAFTAGSTVLLQAGWKDTLLGASQVYAVTAMNATNQTLSLYNPLGAGSAAAGLPETINLTLSDLSAHGDALYFGVSGRQQT